jgi:carbon-monoxide dehydrogenase medium subunit
MRLDEFMTDIAFKAFQTNQRGVFLKLGLRKAQAISVVNATVVLIVEEEDNQTIVTDAQITLGAVAPVIIHAQEAEDYLAGKVLDEDVIQEAARLAAESATPISDVRSSANYRKEMVKVLVRRALWRLWENDLDNIPKDPVLLDLYHKQSGKGAFNHAKTDTIRTTVNGKVYEVQARVDKTLLDFIREDLKLTGSKEGCAEGECGACSVILDGMDVMSCLVPASRAHGANITTVEGIATESGLHPVQSAFIQEGAVQCGYCTPGFIISSAVLLEEKPTPTRDEIKQALTGNLCRCTGYYKIIQAVEQASTVLTAEK